MATITVEVKLFAVLAERAGVRSVSLELPSNALAGTVLQELQEHHPSLSPYLLQCRVAIDHEYVSMQTPLTDGSVVAVIPPVSGGDSPDGEQFFVTSDRLDPAPMVAQLLTNRVGGIVTFAGTVREFTGNHRTTYLEYEVYPDMAVEMFRQIAAEAHERWPGVRLSIGHRVGELNISETSVLVVAAAPHREEAFAACRYAIDELKERAPIWKKEILEQGSYWVGSEERTPEG